MQKQEKGIFEPLCLCLRWSRFHMCPVMFAGVNFLTESLSTILTFKWALSSVYSDVLWKSSALCKTFMTVFTFIRFHPCVNTRMSADIIFLIKTFVTLATLKWPLTSMGSLMHHQNLWPTETFIALIAFKRPLACVWSGMSNQTTLGTKTLVTVAAQERLLFCMRSLMLVEEMWDIKSLATHLACKRLWSMCSFMFFETLCITKYLFTLLTLWLLHESHVSWQMLQYAPWRSKRFAAVVTFKRSASWGVGVVQIH